MFYSGSKELVDHFTHINDDYVVLEETLTGYVISILIKWVVHLYCMPKLKYWKKVDTKFFIHSTFLPFLCYVDNSLHKEKPSFSLHYKDSLQETIHLIYSYSTSQGTNFSSQLTEC